VLLAELVATARAVGETSARNAKVRLIAELLARLDPDEAAVAVGFLSGDPRQGRIGVGWATAFRVDVAPASAPSLEIGDLDDAFDSLQRTTGPGSVEARGSLLASLFSKATAEEADFIRRLLIGEMRQGALDGVVTEAVAKAANVPGEIVRRAAMLSGDLRAAASTALRHGEEGLLAIGLELLRPVQPMLASTAADVTGR
jgi:DNA ligase-1